MSEASAVIVAAFIAAVAALWIGWLQFRATREQNRIAAFEKRLAVFKQTQEALTRIARSGDADIDTQLLITTAVQAAWFLFPADLVAELERIRDEVVDLSTAASLARTAIEQPENRKFINEKARLLKIMFEHLGRLRPLFQPHMSLEPIKAKRPTQFRTERRPLKG